MGSDGWQDKMGGKEIEIQGMKGADEREATEREATELAFSHSGSRCRNLRNGEIIHTL